MFHLARVSAFVLLLSSAAVAQAHGGIPQSQAVLFDPDDPDHIVVAATFGLLETTDRGTTWDWICVQSIPSGRLGFVDPTLLGPAGAIFLAHRDGLRRSTDAGCSWSTTPAALEGSFVADVTLDLSTGDVLALQSDVGIDNQIHRSSDGISFAPLGGAIAAPFLPERVRVAPSDPDRIYVSGAVLAMDGMPAMPFIHTSDDGGDSWTAHAFAFLADELDVLLLAVDGTEPSRVYARVKGEVTDRLVVSEDAGETFRTIDTIAAAPVPNGRPFGFARAADGTLFYGNTEAGLFRTTDESTLEPLVRDLDVACLAIRGDTLHVCANGLAEADGFSVATAPTSEPTDLTPLLTFDRIAAVRACAPPSDVTATCTEWWDDLLRDVGRPVPDAGPGDAAMPDAATDAALPDVGPRDAGGDDSAVDAAPDSGPGGSDPGGCACGVAVMAPGSGAAPLAFLTLVAVYWRRGRSRRRSRREGAVRGPRRPPLAP